MNKGPRSNIWSKFGIFKNVKNDIGIHPQALISHFRPIHNHEIPIINNKNAKKKTKRRLIFPYRALESRQQGVVAELIKVRSQELIDRVAIVSATSWSWSQCRVAQGLEGNEAQVKVLFKKGALFGGPF